MGDVKHGSGRADNAIAKSYLEKHFGISAKNHLRTAGDADKKLAVESGRRQYDGPKSRGRRNGQRVVCRQTSAINASHLHAGAVKTRQFT